MKNYAGIVLVLFLATLPCLARQSAQNKPAADSSNPATSAAVASDPLLRAMRAELDRNVGKLSLPGAPKPYYIEYRIIDRNVFSETASFGAITSQQNAHARVLAVTVRVGSYKQDNTFAQGGGLTDLAPGEDDSYALRHALWIATDRAYKQAVSIYAAKQSMMQRYQNQQAVDDFSHEPVVTHIAPLATLQLGTRNWTQELSQLSGMYREDPLIENFRATLQITAANNYFVNSEGTTLRKGLASYAISILGDTQSADGMRLYESHGETTPTLQEFPSLEKLQAATHKIIERLGKLRAAPAVNSEYEGPVILVNRAADLAVSDIIGNNILGIPPQPGSTARTSGAYADSYQQRILPTFVSIADDPALKSFKGEGLLSDYQYDDEGVKAEKLNVVENGNLVDYLTTRKPIRGFSESNGHARAEFTMYGSGATASPSTLIVSSSKPVPLSELKQRLISLCKDQGLTYGYMVDQMSALSSESESNSGGYNPLLLYRIYVSDGHEELVRGAELDDLDTRSMRNNLLALGDDPFLEGAGTEDAPVGLISPSMLFSNLEIKASQTGMQKLPAYPAPPLRGE